MPEVSFTIGDAFPADEPVARFVAVVAMISNDWQRLARQMIELDDSEPEGDEHAALMIMSYRLQAGLFYEAARFLKKAHANFPDVRRFVDNLPAEATEEFDLVVGGIDPDSPSFLGKWLKDARNRMFHYSELNSGKPIGKALRSAAEHNGAITTGKTIESVRFGFADVVALEWLGGSDPGDTDADRMAALSRAVLAMTQFAQRAISVYLSSKGVEPTDD
jgi:hypothetical protein